MPDSLVLEARTPGKTKHVRDLRKAGLIPGVLYGRGAEPVAFQVDVPSLPLRECHQVAYDWALATLGVRP